MALGSDTIPTWCPPQVLSFGPTNYKQCLHLSGWVTHLHIGVPARKTFLRFAYPRVYPRVNIFYDHKYTKIIFGLSFRKCEKIVLKFSQLFRRKFLEWVHVYPEHRKYYFGDWRWLLWRECIFVVSKLFRFISSWEVCYMWMVWEYYDKTWSFKQIPSNTVRTFWELAWTTREQHKLSQGALQEQFRHVVKTAVDAFPGRLRRSILMDLPLVPHVHD